ncbi:hypothetical protein [Shimia ponticola]|uniref:hypothetical protein n=1 Tax=Shimia ponticola TaxID=2582893 RepID=UPI0011BDBEC6|nr:hypothetical protein [Shimia ponticola]
MYRVAFLGLAIAGLAACEPIPGEGTINLPEQVIALAGPGQDLTTARVLESDGCYWYEHTNVVETTLLPLRTVDLRPICTRPQTPDA